MYFYSCNSRGRSNRRKHGKRRKAGAPGAGFAFSKPVERISVFNTPIRAKTALFKTACSKQKVVQNCVGEKVGGEPSCSRLCRKSKICRNQSRGGTLCPPEGSCFAKLFPAVRILKNQDRRNVCLCQAVFCGGSKPPAPTTTGILFPVQPVRVSLSDCVWQAQRPATTRSDL